MIPELIGELNYLATKLERSRYLSVRDVDPATFRRVATLLAQQERDNVVSATVHNFNHAAF